MVNVINVAKCIIQQKDKYLLIKRAPSSNFFPSQWDFPGGKLESGESAANCAVREAKEETNLDVKLGQTLKTGTCTENGVTIHYELFQVNECVGTIKLSKEHTDQSWFSKEQIKQIRPTKIVKIFFDVI